MRPHDHSRLRALYLAKYGSLISEQRPDADLANSDLAVVTMIGKTPRKGAGSIATDATASPRHRNLFDWSIDQQIRPEFGYES